MVQRYGVLSKQIVLHVRETTVLYLKRFKNNIADKSQIKYLKYILGVSKHTFSNVFFYHTLYC